MNRLTAEQLRRNEQTRSNWAQYKSHRDRITDLVRNFAPQATPATCKELTILGAGNCNDLDLNALLADGWQIHLVDLDADALTRGTSQQGLAGDDRIATHGGVDLTSMWDELSSLTPETDPELVREIAQRLPLSRPTYELPPAHVVLSVGLISQLVEAAVLSIGDQHPAFVELVQALRLQHLRLVNELTEPGGTFIVTSEVVSTDTAPQLAGVHYDELPSVLSKLLLEGNFFSGLHPGLIGQTLQTDRAIADQMESLRVAGPWLWNLGVRTYAVCGFVGVKTMMNRSS